MKISTSFYPIRIVEGKPEPVVLTVYLKNNSEKDLLASMLLKIPFSLGFDKIGLEREKVKRIGTIKAGAEKAIPIMLYPKYNIKEGEYLIKIKVFEHEERYDKTKAVYEAETKLRVIKP